MCTPCLWSLWRYVYFWKATCLGSDCPRFQLVIGRDPFNELLGSINILVPKGTRPTKPRHFDAPGMTPAVWKIAQKCWRQKAKERPEVYTVLRSLERLANPGVYGHIL